MLFVPLHHSFAVITSADDVDYHHCTLTSQQVFLGKMVYLKLSVTMFGEMAA